MGKLWEWKQNRDILMFHYLQNSYQIFHIEQYNTQNIQKNKQKAHFDKFCWVTVSCKKVRKRRNRGRREGINKLAAA